MKNSTGVMLADGRRATMRSAIRFSVIGAMALTATVLGAASAGAQSAIGVPTPGGGAEQSPIGGVGAPPQLSQPSELTQPPALSAPPDLNTPPAAAAAPSECQEKMEEFSQRRNNQLKSINALMKSGKSKAIDPIAACPKFRGLVGIESQMRAWVLKNKDWCGIPDQIVEQMKVGFARTPQFAEKACAAAAMVKRNREIMAHGGGPAGPIPAQPAVKLPSGPL